MHPQRALGGIYALQGFEFQIQCYLADLFDHLINSNVQGIKQSLSAFETLQDHTFIDTQQNIITVQAKRTLTTSTLKKALEEIALIEQFRIGHQAYASIEIHYEVVCQISELTTAPAQYIWSQQLPTIIQNDPVKLRVLQQLDQQQRLKPISIRPNPKWQALSTIWQHVQNPFIFWRFAFQQTMTISPQLQSAAVIHEQICEKFIEQRLSVPTLGEWLTPQHFTVQHDHIKQQLEIGKQATINRLNKQQYMQRTDRLADINQHLTQLDSRSKSQPTEQYQPLHRDAIPVFWISGRSGSGKSVLLLQLVRELVNQGKQVVWLGSKVEKLKPLLERYLAALDEQSQPQTDVIPDFIAIDDMYDPAAQTQLDVQTLQDLTEAFENSESFQNAAATGQLPIILTCGPSEFAQDFDYQTNNDGFSLHKFDLGLVSNEESQQLKRWHQERTASTNIAQHDRFSPEANQGSGDAFSQAATDQGLMLSMVMELNFGDITKFAAKFAKRIIAAGLNEALRVPLALNRLYINTPKEWYSASQLERFDTLNQDGDFNPLEIFDGKSSSDANQRLTHPHLGDALYKALLQELRVNNATSITNDLIQAFQWSVQQDNFLYFQLLKVFSGVEQHSNRRPMTAIHLQTQRLSDAHRQNLALECAKIWQQHDVKNKKHRFTSYINANWAAWAAQFPDMKCFFDVSPLTLALNAMENNLRDWPRSWLTAFDFYPEDPELLQWALQHLTETEFITHKTWSLVWEVLEPSQSENKTWQDAGITWLNMHSHRPDWHLVWKKLYQIEVAGKWQNRQYQPSELGENLLASHLNCKAWAYVFQDMLKELPTERGKLIGFSSKWLELNINQPEWAHVWNVLITLSQTETLPKTIDVNDLIKQGNDWLQYREERPEWNYVWQALIAIMVDSTLPETIAPDSLIKQGMDWLTGRHHLIEWVFVWQTLVELHLSEQMPNAIDISDLVKQGKEWLIDRENLQEWNYVWQKLLALSEQPALKPIINMDDLLIIGANWLEGRSEQPEWRHVWQSLISVHQNKGLPAAIDIASLIKQGTSWLVDTEEQPEWAHIWQDVLAMYKKQELIDSDAALSLITQGKDWLNNKEDQPEWAHIWQDLLAITELEQQFAFSRQDIAKIGLQWLEKQHDATKKEVGFVVEHLIDAGCNATEYLTCYRDWFSEYQNKTQRVKTDWLINALKFVLLAPYSSLTDQCADTLNQFIATHPNHFIIRELSKSADTATKLKTTKCVQQLFTTHDALEDHRIWQQLTTLQNNEEAIHYSVEKKRKHWCAISIKIDDVVVIASMSLEDINSRDRSTDKLCYIHSIEPRKGLIKAGIKPKKLDGISFDEFIQQFEVGDSLEVEIKNIVDYGMFVSHRQLDGLIHKSEIPANIDFQTAFTRKSCISATLIKVDSDQKRVWFGLNCTSSKTSNSTA